MDHQSQLDAAKAVINAEAAALNALSDHLDGAAFSTAVDMLLRCQSHCVVLGVGKSGHIGRKIAATFASTGTPSFFVHPAEASHGDLGMITLGSVVLAISNSGESRELVDALRFCQKRDVPIIAMTCRPESTLGKAANVLLSMPAIPEACPNGLVPTTSMAMTLALGDALCLGVMQKRGFSAGDFGDRHPGGKLGLQLQKVSDWLQNHDTPPPIVALGAPAQEVLSAISKGRMGCAAIVDEGGKLAGMITDGDLRRALSDNFFEKTAQKMMTRNPFTAALDDRMSDIIAELTHKRIANVFVLKDGKPIAAMHLKDLLEEGYL